MDKKGYTLLEMSLTMLIGLSVTWTLFMIPGRMFSSYANYTKEADVNRMSHRLMSAINNDLIGAQRFSTPEDGEGFEIDEHTYRFTDEGVFRYDSERNQTLQVTDIPLKIELKEDVLTLISEENQLTGTVIELVFAIDDLYVEEGGTGYE